MRTVCFSPRAAAAALALLLLATAGAAQEARLKLTIPLASGNQLDMAMSPDGARVVVVTDKDPVTLWDVTTGKKVRDYEGGSPCVALSPDGKRLACCGVGAVLVRDVETGKVTHRFPWKYGLRKLAFSTSGKTLALLGERQIVLWTLETNRRLTAFPTQMVPQTVGVDQQTLSMVFAPDGQALYYLSQVARGGSVKASVPMTYFQWVTKRDLRTGKDKILSSHGSNSQSYDGLYLFPDGKTLVYGACRIDRTKGGMRPGPLYGGQALGFSPDGRTVAATGPGGVSLCDAATGKRLWYTSGQSIEFVAPAFTPDGRLLVTAHGSTAGIRLAVWDVADFMQKRAAK